MSPSLLSTSSLSTLPALEGVEAHRVVSEARAAEIIGVSLVQMRRMRRQGLGPSYVRLGLRKIGYQLGTVVGFVAARVVGTGDDRAA